MIKNLTVEDRKFIMTSREARLKAQKKYDDTHRVNYKFFHIKCNKQTEGDIVEYLQGKDNVNSFVKDLIRKEMAGKN